MDSDPSNIIILQCAQHCSLSIGKSTNTRDRDRSFMALCFSLRCLLDPQEYKLATSAAVRLPVRQLVIKHQGNAPYSNLLSLHPNAILPLSLLSIQFMVNLPCIQCPL
jgi:hypothetical protein